MEQVPMLIVGFIGFVMLIIVLVAKKVFAGVSGTFAEVRWGHVESIAPVAGTTEVCFVTVITDCGHTVKAICRTPDQLAQSSRVKVAIVKFDLDTSAPHSIIAYPAGEN